ncbi:Cof subfamily protein (haloacid dehalogenase superfamily) [Actinoplanes octamycinicus]|uniref:Cof subfamily protein (Haloacid dehalogenase superfamily) n=1 Tax=Actinoplanes octamycinicus TaxID=135948 RepID=A0A7W7GTL5_9ACTN|nr:Cof-type HAD-IIB family hydrolase [Actinoplanes octamycinicus]MBB4738054.1 Cof subfamily protein (haloacid dehalogenase superfamily) [Actinoplanes octamycinicus]GIE59393.1 hydrolase [Actinoplanes octamycinicus]
MLKPGLPKLIATDLDGTLVRSDDTVSAYTHEVLDRVRAAGIRIVAATGRGPRLTSLTRNDIRVADYLVLAQGGWVLDQAESRYLRQARLPGWALADVLARLESVAGPLSVMFEALEHDDAPLWGDYDPTWRYPVTVESRTRTECLSGDVIKAFARSFQHHVDELLDFARRVVPPEVATVTQAGLDYVEICPAQVDKGTGLAVVAEAVGVDPEDVLVFGDMPNDLPMFGWAGWGRVAVANAHPELKAAADEVTLTNDQDGVAVFLDRLLSR